MDETKGTPKDSLQKPGQASKGNEGNTSKETEPQTYSQEQLDQIVVKAKSDALSTAGRTDKSLTDRETAVKAREDAIKVEQERKDAAERAEAQKDPDKWVAYQAGQVERDRAKGLDEREANLVRNKADHEAEVTAAKETQREIVIFEIATAKGVDPVKLKELSTEFNIDGKEKLEKLAEEIASGKPKLKPGDPGFEADNALTKGGLGEKSEEQRLKERYPTM